MSEPIDTGTAPEIYCDDLGSIKIHPNTVEFNAVRFRGEDGDRFVNLTVIVPRTAIPSICRQLANAFAEVITYSVVEGLRRIASRNVH